jgi:tetratricopeptide (TPR) repeat protein
MKASVSPHIVLIAILGVSGSLVRLSAQDVVVQKDNQRRTGEILGIADGKLKLKIGPVETSIAMNQVASVTKAPPTAYEKALADWARGDANKTLATLKPLVDNFMGLPAPWVERSAALLGEVYLSLDKLPEAEAAFAAFQKAYPSAASLSDIGLARLAVAKKDYATAKIKLEPLVAEASKIKAVGGTKSAMYGQAFYLMGLVRENEGAYPEALQDYLSAVTLFHEDQAVVAKAQQRADALIEKKVIVP